MDIIKEWAAKLEKINDDISIYQNYLDNPPYKLKLHHIEMARAEIDRKTRYKNLIEETLRRLQECKKDNLSKN